MNPINFQTLYNVRAKVEPLKGSEFCRARCMCHLSINLDQVKSSTDEHDGWKKKKVEEKTPLKSSSSTAANNSIMYEVITDPTMWAVCERSSGTKLNHCAIDLFNTCHSLQEFYPSISRQNKV